ncbi:MAG: DUF6221 family protein [Rhodococcus sp. (in: high G+C Gram-positive bacteria)]
MNEILGFLHARIDEDEAVARAIHIDPNWEYDETSGVGGIVYECGDGAWIADKVGPVNGAHITRQDPARILREVEAKRATIDILTHWPTWVTPQDPIPLPALTALRHMASVYAGHPDYRQEWAVA